MATIRFQYRMCGYEHDAAIIAPAIGGGHSHGKNTGIRINDGAGCTFCSGEGDDQRLCTGMGIGSAVGDGAASKHRPRGHGWGCLIGRGTMDCCGHGASMQNGLRPV